MTTLSDIYTGMHSYNNTVAPGSECTAWQDFVADCYSTLGHAPWADEFWQDEVPAHFASHWCAIANGDCEDYDATTGSYIN